MTEPDIPTATLAYHAEEPANAWRVVTRMVGTLAFAYGVIRLLQLANEIVIPMIFGGGWGRFGPVDSGSFLRLIVFVVYVLGSVTGGVLLVVGGRGVGRSNPRALRTLQWGALLAVAVHVLIALASIIQFVHTRGVMYPQGIWAFYVGQSLVGLVAGLLLPAFLAYFASRPDVRRAN